MIKVVVLLVKIIASIFGIISAACAIINSTLLWEQSYIVDENSLEKIWTKKRNF